MCHVFDGDDRAGNTMEATLTILKEWGVKRIKVMSLIATTSGAYPRPPWTLHVHTHAALARVFILF
jgi:hypothetical protein